jgi:hypothetical protein
VTQRKPLVATCEGIVEEAGGSPWHTGMESNDACFRRQFTDVKDRGEVVRALNGQRWMHPPFLRCRLAYDADFGVKMIFAPVGG